MKLELEATSDAAGFVEKLTFDNIKKDEELKELRARLKEFAEKVNREETDLADTQEMIDLQSQEMEHLEEEIQKHLLDKAEQQKHLNMLNDQIGKYKQRIRELTESNSMITQSMDGKEEESLIQNYFNTDVYQHKYYELSKLHQHTLHGYIDYQLHMGSVRHYAGHFLANLVDTLPEQFCQQLYPHLMNLLMKVTSANHKLYLLFDAVSAAMTHKSELYAPEQETLVAWMLMVLDQVPIIFGSLLKIEFAITSADSEEDLLEIVSNPDLKEQVGRVDIFTQELLQRVIGETIDTDIDFDPYIESVETLDKVSLAVKRLPTELATRLELCSETMRCIQQLLSSIECYRRTS